MTNTPSLIAAIVLVAVAALYALRAWKPFRFGLTDRVGAIIESMGLLTLFTVLHFAAGWAGVPVILWIVAVVAAAAGVTGLVLRFDSLPWSRARRRPRWRIVRLTIAGATCGGVLVLGAMAFSG